MRYAPPVRPGTALFKVFVFPAFILSLVFSVTACASQQGVTSAEEYYSLGMAYFELGKFDEAEKWLNRARQVDKTQVASEYNLGRISFETGKYEAAAAYFDRILQRDPVNVLALKAAAYTWIKLGDLARAEALYDRVLALVPESTDDGYNYALILFALDKPEKTEEVLARHELALYDNNDAILLLARAQRAQNKVEAIESYGKWLANNTSGNNLVRYEYAQVLEAGEFYARALEEYRLLLTALPQAAAAANAGSTAQVTPGAAAEPQRATVRYSIARLLLIADPDSEEGVTELTQAVGEGYADTAALEALLEDGRVPAARKEAIKRLIGEITAKETAPAEQDAPESST
ncbi:hypothetical protein FACS189483_09870 [Spirochaetia bacterium]|nr:hypothetical protein FACS189483_09870 [Spirochaetia bacterium]